MPKQNCCPLLYLNVGLEVYGTCGFQVRQSIIEAAKNKNRLRNVRFESNDDVDVDGGVGDKSVETDDADSSDSTTFVSTETTTSVLMATSTSTMTSSVTTLKSEVVRTSAKSSPASSKENLIRLVP